MSHTYVISQIAVMAIITLALRVAPFLIFGGKKTPPVIQFLGTYLPYAIMGMLVVYCLKDVSVISAPHGLPELIAIVLVAVLHIWRRNTLLSIVSGTVCYMLLIQFCF
ncbi:MAG: AzlD domain-containing protein [Oscillospiraceae bacterium]|nr:AzlD domain-containing protein [Oscillospiraceae bacterium]